MTKQPFVVLLFSLLLPLSMLLVHQARISLHDCCWSCWRSCQDCVGSPFCVPRSKFCVPVLHPSFVSQFCVPSFVILVLHFSVPAFKVVSDWMVVKVDWSWMSGLLGLLLLQSFSVVGCWLSVVGVVEIVDVLVCCFSISAF